LRSSDTHPDADRVQIELLRGATDAQRAALARSLSCTVMGLVRQGIADRNPTASQDELSVEFIRVCYGPELAREVRQDLEARRQHTGRLF
jgi:hypothetical protein